VQHQTTDYIGKEVSLPEVNYAVRSFAALSLTYEWISTDPYISPGSLLLDEYKGLFRNFPNTMVVAGDAEQFLDQIRTLRDRLEADIGDDMVYLEIPDAFHDFLAFPFAEPERTVAFKSINKWISQLYE